LAFLNKAIFAKGHNDNPEELRGVLREMTNYALTHFKTEETYMKASIAIGVKCDNCHAGKKQYTKKFEMAEEMFKLSEMMDVECDFCHNGKNILTPEGKTARTAMLLQKWRREGNKKCLKCHVERTPI